MWDCGQKECSQLINERQCVWRGVAGEVGLLGQRACGCTATHLQSEKSVDTVVVLGMSASTVL